MDIDLQPLRVISGWEIESNQFYEVDPSPTTMHYLDSSSLLHLNNRHRKKGINLEWRPENDVNGEFILRVLNLTVTFNQKTQEFDYDGDWENLHLEFRSKSRLEIVEKLEQIMI